jgi:hypothetical protein
VKKTFLCAALLLPMLQAGEVKSVTFPSITFKMPADKDFKVMQRNCQWCHSYGYILNQGKQSRTFWHHVVLKMRDVYKAPISERDERLATDYLARHFGNGEP